MSHTVEGENGTHCESVYTSAVANVTESTQSASLTLGAAPKKSEPENSSMDPMITNDYSTGVHEASEVKVSETSTHQRCVMPFK